MKSISGIMLLFVALSLQSIGVFAADRLSEVQVRVAFIYNFAKFTEWPASVFSTPQSPLTLCFIDESQTYTRASMSIDGKLVQGRVLRVRYVTNLEMLKTCQLLYLSGLDEKRMVATLQMVANFPVVTIGDSERFTAAGGMIGFVAVDENLRFEVNLDAARRANVAFSALLLKLAAVVRDGHVKAKQL